MTNLQTWKTIKDDILLFKNGYFQINYREQVIRGYFTRISIVSEDYRNNLWNFTQVFPEITRSKRILRGEEIVQIKFYELAA